MISFLFFTFLDAYQSIYFKTIHRIHHKAITPVALEYIYVHPLEWLMGYIGPFIAIYLISLFCPVSILAFLVLSVNSQYSRT